MLIFSGALKKVVRQMEKDRIFNDDDINAIADLMEIMDNADPESNIYKVSLEKSDYISDLLGSTSQEKKGNKSRFNIRKKNQKKVEELSLRAENINDAKKYLKQNERERE